MIRIVLISLLVIAAAGSGFLYFWDIPVERQMVETELDPTLLRE